MAYEDYKPFVINKNAFPIDRLKTLKEEFDLKLIAKKIEEYRKIVNNHARKIFMNLKDAKYP